MNMEILEKAVANQMELEHLSVQIWKYLVVDRCHDAQWMINPFFLIEMVC